ncbi:hypothetical protein ABG067_000459 [Albugo candida]
MTHSNRNIALLATGSTDGRIHVWDFSRILEHLSTGTHPIHNDAFHLSPCYSYVAHEMGANALSLIPSKMQPTSINQLIVSVCSGGDDQSVRVRDISPSNESLCWITIQDAQVPHASGSAIKALYSNGNVLIIAGYDQRLSVYALNPIVWKACAMSECADVAALDVRQHDAENSV